MSSGKQSRIAFHYYPRASAYEARTFVLDWNVASRLTAVYEGTTFSKDPRLQARLIDLDRRIPAGAKVIPGFAAAEPEARPTRDSFDASRLYSRTAIAIAMLEQGRGMMSDFLRGGIDPKQTVNPLQISAGRSGNPLELAKVWIWPTYCVLLKAVVLEKTIQHPDERVDKFEFWLNHTLGYRPSREIWLGMLLLAGTPKGKDLARNLLKLNLASSQTDRVADLWGGAWDVFYTRLPGFSTDPKFLGEFGRPFVLVTDDTKLDDAINAVHLIDTVSSQAGVQLGREYMQLDGLIDPDHRSRVEQALAKISKRITDRAKPLTVNALRRAVARQATILERELEAAEPN
jgi:hypothetical protein